MSPFQQKSSVAAVESINWRDMSNHLKNFLTINMNDTASVDEQGPKPVESQSFQAQHNQLG